MANIPDGPSSHLFVVPVSPKEWSFEFPRLDDRVYDMFHQALAEMDVGRYGRAEKDLRLLIQGFPEFIDAYHHLALILDRTRRRTEAHQVWATAEAIGRRAFPPAFKHGKHKLPWVILENRPFLRISHAWGLVLLEDNHVKDAVKMFRAMLRMNPNDNQGIRALLIDCYFRLGQPARVLTVCGRYRDDIMEEVLYGRPLALFQLQREVESRIALLKAIDIFPLVAMELVKKTHRRPKNLSPRYVTMGGRDQAYFYWQQNAQYWQQEPGALELVASVLSSRSAQKGLSRAP